MTLEAIQVLIATDGLKARAEANEAGADRLRRLGDARDRLRSQIDQTEDRVLDLAEQIEREANRGWWDVPKYFSKKGEHLALDAERARADIAHDQEALEQARGEQKVEFDEILSAQASARSAVQFVTELQDSLRSDQTDGVRAAAGAAIAGVAQDLQKDGLEGRTAARRDRRSALSRRSL